MVCDCDHITYGGGLAAATGTGTRRAGHCFSSSGDYTAPMDGVADLPVSMATEYER